MEEGQVLVLGGIFRQEKVSRTRKFPLLGDIPLLGMVFRTRTSNIRRIEYIIFLIPKVILVEEDNG